jgi:glycosyltransferase involved in cell wall biosynthesis
VPRAGTTWLHAVLESHPEVYVPQRRKELYFFNLYYDRGVSWYKKFFPPDSEAGRFRAIGEITPHYFYGSTCPERMAKLPVEKLLLMLRNPIDRAYSYYALKVRDGIFWGTFEEFLREWPVIEQGYYTRYLENYLQYFDRDQILILIYETALRDVDHTQCLLAQFLSISPEKFSPAAGDQIVNPSYVPKARRAYGVAFRVSRVLREWDLDWVVNAAKRLGVKEAFGVAGKAPPMLEETRAELTEAYEDEIDALEQFLGVSLDVWRNGRVEAPLDSVGEVQGSRH